ncbi:DUF835 domain-containing protein [Palaeococcus ferrophilus]|uniref:DUF835 domain-containing protein n=1 Tax=Palaeococcus ferrophilus TaxID=83868 RepID=UPI0006961301|nr:DUF835 domain-containing protein [Palaeococcus ferrophilus]
MDALHAVSFIVNIVAIALVGHSLRFLLSVGKHLEERGKRLVPATLLGGILIALGMGAWLVFLPSLDSAPVVGLEAFIAAGVAWVAYSWARLNREMLEERSAVEVRKVGLDPGLYLCKEGCDEVANHLLLTHPSMVISREPRTKVEHSLNLDGVAFWWLSKVEGDHVIAPTRLPFLSYNITEFLDSHERPFVYLDGLEYLILENGFETVFKFLTAIKDQAILKGGVILVKISPDAYELKEYRLLLREFNIIEAKRAIITSGGAVYLM